jgi:hypothetical protein
MFQVQHTLFDEAHCEPATVAGYHQVCLGHSLLVNDTFATDIKSDTRLCRRGDKVDVYRNLNIKDMMSCKQRYGQWKGKVTGYAKAFVLVDFEFVVSEASRQRVLREQRKNVHGFCRGVLEDAFNAAVDINALPSNHRVVTYNPYRAGYFFDRSTNEPIHRPHETYALVYGGNVYLMD